MEYTELESNVILSKANDALVKVLLDKIKYPYIVIGGVDEETEDLFTYLSIEDEMFFLFPMFDLIRAILQEKLKDKDADDLMLPLLKSNEKINSLTVDEIFKRLIDFSAMNEG